MKEQTVRQSMSWIHTWLGLLAGWVLYLIFVTGTAAYFRAEITTWMQPEMHGIAPASPKQAAASAVEYLEQAAPHATEWTIQLPDDRALLTRVYWRDMSMKGMVSMAPHEDIFLDPVTGQPAAVRATRGGEFFYRFHYQLQLPQTWGRWIVGLCAMFMLGAIISGIITHKRLFADFFTLRWSKGQRSWLDAHNASAVLALPFHLMITYTGLITLMASFMPFTLRAAYPDPGDYMTHLFARAQVASPRHEHEPPPPIAALMDTASREWTGGTPGKIVFSYPDDSGGTITIFRRERETILARSPAVTFSAEGKRLYANSPGGAGTRTAAAMRGIHAGRFASPVVRWLYVAMGVSGIAMVATGLLLWVVARRRKKSAPLPGHILVERLNVAVIIGFPFGIAVHFLANRLLPVAMPDRAAMEVTVLFAAWAGFALASVVRKPSRAWQEGWIATAAAFAAVPVVNALTTDRGLLPSLTAGDRVFAGFDLMMLLLSAFAAFAAWRSARAEAKASAAPTRRRRAPDATGEASNA